MSVLFANTSLSVQTYDRNLPEFDSHGQLYFATLEAPRGPWPGSVRPPGRTLADEQGPQLLQLDPAAWPLLPRDLVIEPSTGDSWTVVTSQLMTNDLDPSVNYVRVQAHPRSEAGTLP
jgi:hypothetical protein